MTKEETINHLKDILAEATETEHAVCYVTNEDAEALEMAIEELKQPERKTGKWEEVKNADGASHDYRCSVCHRYRFHNGEMRSKYKYCPNCGCRMVEQRESEDKE